MNIIIDASPLGIGFYYRQAKTGVSRVVEQLVQGLWRANGIDLSLAAPTHLAETWRYARATFGAAAPPLINRVSDLDWARLENALLRPFPVDSLPSKGVRTVFFRARKAFRETSLRFDAPRLPAGAVYHSPFYAIPDDIARMRHVHKVLTVHDLLPIHNPEWFPSGERAVQEAIKGLPDDARIVTVSRATKDDFCNYTGIDPSRVTPIHLAASRDLFYPLVDAERILATRRRFGLGEEPYLLSLATLEPRKNIGHLIRCFTRLAESGELARDVKLVLVGAKGWKTDSIPQEPALPPALRSRLVFTGFVPDEHLAPLYGGALAFVYPSLAEGFGLPPLEAMQCGLPVICSNVASLPEVVGEAAVQVPPRDADALSQAMLTVVGSEAKRSELSAKALQQAGHFSWERFVQEHIDLYRTITGN